MLAVVTDSIACLPRELVQHYGIVVVPVTILHSGQSFRDGVDLSLEQAWEWLRRGEPVTTSQPAVGEFLEVYQRLATTAAGIVSIHVSSGVTGVYQAAAAAARLVSSVPIRVIDSQTATMAEGFLVLEAARQAAHGADLDTLVRRVEQLRSEVHFFAVLETVALLVRSGRAPFLAQLAVDLLQIKPILSLSNGQIVVLERVRTRSRAIEAMLRRMQSDVGECAVHVAVLHAGAEEEAISLADRVRANFSVVECYVTPFTPAMALYTGPGLLGLAYYAERLPQD